MSSKAFDARGARIPGTMADGSIAAMRRRRRASAKAGEADASAGSKPAVGRSRPRSSVETKPVSARGRRSTAASSAVSQRNPKGTGSSADSRGSGRSTGGAVLARGADVMGAGSLQTESRGAGSPVDRTLLEVPFDRRYEARNAGAKYDAKTKTSYYDGPLPDKLAAWKSQDYSYTRWVEDQLNKKVRPVALGPVMFTPREHQAAAAVKMRESFDDGWPGFLIADSTGLGKTLSITAGVCSVAKARHATKSKPLKTLVVCPKGAMGVWRQTFKAYEPSTTLRPLIINYQQLNKLIKPPAGAGKPRKTKTGKTRKPSARTTNRQIARNGTPKINFDVIVFDESHYLKNYGSSGMSLAACTIARLDEPYAKGKSPFVIYSTATPGSTPLNLAIMSPILAKAIDPNKRKHIKPGDWGRFLADEGFHVSKGKSGWNWVTIPWYGAKSDDPKERAKYERGKAKAQALMDEDTKRIGEALARPSSPFLSRDPTQLKNWPKQPVEPFYIELDAEGKQMYEDAWTRFRGFLQLKQKGQTDPKDALTENLRFRQKASLLKAPVIAEHAADLVAEGNQVFIGCEFLETVDVIMSALKAKRIPVAEFTGRAAATREANRIAFQKGECKVIIANVAEAVSFHAGESLPDGSKATSAQRISIIADVRQNPNDCIQQMGRAHRDGQCSPVEFPVILDTVDVKVMDSFIKKARNLNNMKAESDPDYLDRVFADML